MPTEACSAQRRGQVSDISHAQRVPGWMDDEELVYLAGEASRHALIVEVGSWMGRSTCAMAANTQGRVIACDTWAGSPEHADMLKDKSPRWLKEQFLAHAGQYENMVPFQCESVALAYAFGKLGIYPDMVFLDAGHDYESVKADILAWKPLLRSSNSVMCGHDYSDQYWPGVKRAVTELVPKFRTVHSIWTTEGA